MVRYIFSDNIFLRGVKMFNLKLLMKAGLIASNICAMGSLSYYYVHDKYCLEDRYAFDIGSGSIKVKYVSFDKCSDEIVKVFAQYAKPIATTNHLIKDENTGLLELSNVGIENIEREIKNFQYDLKMDCKMQKCAGVTTAWARKAANADAIIERIKSLGVNVKKLSQDEEGMYSFYSVTKNHPESDVKDMIVWDIGGRSFQLSTLNDDGGLYVYHGDIGIESFYQEMKSVYSGDEPFFAGKMLDDIFEYAYQEYGQPIMMDNIISKKLTHNIKVYGVGAGMTRGFKKEMYMPYNMTLDHLMKAARVFENKTILDAKSNYYPDIPMHYMQSAQASVILASSIMKGMNVESINISESTLSDYIVFDKDLW